MRPGDIVVAMNGVAVDLDNPLPNLLKRLAPGQLVDLLIIRNGRELLITLSPWLE
jgi:serine protease Do